MAGMRRVIRLAVLISLLLPALLLARLAGFLLLLAGLLSAALLLAGLPLAWRLLVLLAGLILLAWLVILIGIIHLKYLIWLSIIPTDLATIAFITTQYTKRIYGTHAPQFVHRGFFGARGGSGCLNSISASIDQCTKRSCNSAKPTARFTPTCP